GFCTRFVAAPAEATPKTRAAAITKPRSIVRTAATISVLLLPPLGVRILSSPRQGRQAARLDRLRHMRPARPSPFAVQRTSMVITVETFVRFSAGAMRSAELREVAAVFGLA